MKASKKKRKFSSAVRYAVWFCHQKRCWFCLEPLRFKETTIDHFFPESLLKNHDDRKKALSMYGLTDEDFDINGFENWLPCHAHCNQKKGNYIFIAIPANQLMIKNLKKQAPEVNRIAEQIKKDVEKDKTIGKLYTALEQNTISEEDLQKFYEMLCEKFDIHNIHKNLILLDNGYWVSKNDIAYEGECQCEREICVESKNKVYCYFSPFLSPWVIKAGLYWKCYDEIIQCPRCSQRHKRGHIGKTGRCGKPFLYTAT